MLLPANSRITQKLQVHILDIIMGLNEHVTKKPKIKLF